LNIGAIKAIWAALPIFAILVLMLWRGWSAARAGIVGTAIALAIAVLVFGFPGALERSFGLPTAVAGIAAESCFTALAILWIIGPALGIHELQLRTGSAEVLRASLARFAPDPQIMALLVAWFFALFMEGAAGFGASVALAAPFLVAAGFQPVQAVTVTLIGHVVGVSFGAVGTPLIPQMAATGLSGLELARDTGIYHSVLGWLPLVVLVVMVRRSEACASPGRAIWGWTAAAFACFVIPYTALWWWVGPELPTLAGALVGGILFVSLLRVFGPRAASTASTESQASLGALRAAAPYFTLVGLVLLTRLIPALRQFLQGIELRWELWGSFSGSIQPLYHPGTMLFVGFVAGALIQGVSVRSVTAAARDATRRLLPVSVALTAMLFLSRIMVHAEMTDVLALASAEAAGALWPALAPFVGVLGTFVTGSATASNILFTELQRETAIALGLPVAGVLGAQGFGAAVGNMICPHNVVAASATVGLEGQEGAILRRTAWVTLIYAALGAVFALWLLS
jgi:lactate permease